MIETIKEYLVSLGFKVNNSSLNAAQKAMKSAEDSVDGFASSSVKNFAKAATAVVSFVATANIALGKYLVGLAQADLQTEMFARKMWMSKDAAKAYQSSIDALGVSVDDLYLSPELMDKYLELNRQAREMGVPSDEYSKQMQGVRDITFEFQRLKLEGTYALQWIGYHLTKYLAGPLGDSRDWLRKINDEIQQKMPEWTKKIAEVVSWAVRLGKAAWYIRDAIGAAAGVFTAFSLIKMASNPFGAFILGLTALLLLVDDYRAFKDDKSGKSSVFNGLWRAVDKFKKSLEDDGTIGKFKNDLLGLLDKVQELKVWLEKIGQSETFKRYLKNIKRLVVTLGNGVENTWNWLVKLYKELDDNGDLVSFAKTFVDVHGSVVDLIDAIGDLLNALDGKGGLGDTLSSGVISGLEKFRDVMESIAGAVTIVAGGIKGLATGDFSGLEKGLKMFIDGVPKGLMKDSPQAVEAKKRLKEREEKTEEYNKKAGKNIQDKWSSFKNSIPGANTDASSVDWSSLRKGFVSFMNSIPKEFGDISKGLFQAAKGYGNSGSTVGLGGSMSYLYPQTNTSNMSQVAVKQTYNIYGAKDPQSVATTINRTSTSALTRHFQGVNR